MKWFYWCNHLNKNAISVWKHAYTCNNTKFGTFSISLIMEHFLIFLSLQKPVNRLSLYYYYFFNVEGKDTLWSHFNFRASQIYFIDLSYHREKEGAGASTCPFSILFTISFHHLFLGCLFLDPFQYWNIA